MASLPPVGGLGAVGTPLCKGDEEVEVGRVAGLPAPRQAGSPWDGGDVFPSLIWVPRLVEESAASVDHRMLRWRRVLWCVLCSL